MPLRQLVCLALLAWSLPAFSASVIFLKLRHADGSVVELEPGHEFAHVAISYRGLWLHAHPKTGVALVDNILDYGREYLLLDNPAVAEPDPTYVQRWLNRPFDMTYSWANAFANYCARLVGVPLGVTPTPMFFLGSNWTVHYFPPAIEDVGLSPDDILAELRARGGWTETRGCGEELLGHANTNTSPRR